MNKDILDTINKGVNIASKMVTKGVGEVSKTLKPTTETAKITLQTGLYYSRRERCPGKLIPSVGFFEPQMNSKMIVSVFKNLTLPQGERAFIQGCQSLMIGREKEAIERLNESASKDPQLTDSYFLLGCLYLARGEYKLSYENYKKAILLQQTLNKTIRKYLPSFNMTLAVTGNSCFTFFADLIGVNTLLTLALRGDGLRRDAIEVLEQMLGVMPLQPVLLFYIGALLYEAGAYDYVVERLKNAVPDGNIGYLNWLILGRAIISRGDPETAREIFKKGLNKEEMDPEIYLDYRYSLGLCDAGTGGAYGGSETGKVYDAKSDYRDIFERLGLVTGSSQASPVLPPSVIERISAAATPPQQAPPQQAPPQYAPPQAPPALAPQEQPSTPSGKLTIKASQGPPSLVCEAQNLTVSLDRDSFVVGRETGDLVMAWDVNASKAHARFTREGNSYFVEDIGSTNGTWVNQFRISKKVSLNRGDQITIGQTVFRFT
ncbi:MAG: FHA domain-containing protein [Candidatus Eremiobacteraeota bacterium]|nr:FHA domain-containing protein [Candidatus Eremiobacteraeota bacterium]